VVKRAFYHWLPALNNYREGSVVTFAQSLNNIGESLVGQRGQIEQLWAKVYNASRQSFALDLLLLEPEAIQLNLLSKYLRLNNITNFSRNQLKEILKHLDSPQKKHSFKLLSHPWLVQDGEVRLQKK